ncbi:MAG: penicillin acylase family protein, partial [Dehalococcoidia bacterium]
GWSGTAFNFVFASVEDRVAYRFAGQVPRREVGQGLLPQQGPRSPGPPECLPGSELPRTVDPASGDNVSANNAPRGSMELGEEWAEPRRAERIRSLLDWRERHDVASFAAIQGDRYSANLFRLRDLILAQVLDDGAAGAADAEARALLERWDGHLEARGAAGALVSATYRALATDVAERLAGPLGRAVLGQAVEGVPATSAFAYRIQGTLVTAAERATAPWFTGPDDRDRRLRAALGRATSILRARCGDDPATWGMRAVQYWRPNHPLGDIPGVGRLFSRPPRAMGGDVNTVVQAQSVPWQDLSRISVAPGYRQVIDLADWDRSLFMLPSGNSGIPGHPRYEDCVREFLAGEHRPLLFSRAAIEAAAEERLTLDVAATTGEDAP